MMGAWLKDHVVTIAAWAGMLVTMIVTAGVQWSLAADEVNRHQSAISAIEVHDKKQDDKITAIESDVRSVTEAQGRLEGLVIRQEAAVREMQTLTAELKAHVRVMRGRE